MPTLPNRFLSTAVAANLAALLLAGCHVRDGAAPYGVAWPGDARDGAVHQAALSGARLAEAHRPGAQHGEAIRVHAPARARPPRVAAEVAAGKALVAAPARVTRPTAAHREPAAVAASPATPGPAIRAPAAEPPATRLSAASETTVRAAEAPPPDAATAPAMPMPRLAIRPGPRAEPRPADVAVATPAIPATIVPASAPPAAAPPAPAAPPSTTVGKTQPPTPGATPAPRVLPPAAGTPATPANPLVPPPAAEQATPTSPAPGSQQEVQQLMSQAEIMLRIGNVQGARQRLEQARGKSPELLVQLAGTYDPLELARLAIVPPGTANADRAVELYTEAAGLGSAMARSRLERLQELMRSEKAKR